MQIETTWVPGFNGAGGVSGDWHPVRVTGWDAESQQITFTFEDGQTVTDTVTGRTRAWEDVEDGPANWDEFTTLNVWR